MGFLDRFTKSDEEKAAEDLAEEEAEQAQAALAAGGIPPKAQRRLAELRASGDDAFFTSTLSVPEALLVREDGLRPVTQVMGSSIYHVGWQYQRTWTSWGGDAGFQELTIVARAWNEARRLAFSRMYQEAAPGRRPCGRRRARRQQPLGVGARRDRVHRHRHRRT